METFDGQMAQRVWQRVRGAEEPILSLLTMESQAAAVYRQLIGRLPKYRRLFEQLLKKTQYHIRCLRGIGYLTAGVRPAKLKLKPRQETVAGLLRTCYLQNLKAAEEYSRHQDNPEYGSVFAQLAQEKRQHCLLLLALLGGDSPKKSTR